MIIHRIRTFGFRNLADQQVSTGPRFNIIFGANAQGKTNFLEAIYVISTLRSFRTSKSNEMIQTGNKQACIEATVEIPSLLNKCLEVQLLPHGRRAMVDGKATKNALEFLHGLSVVLFSPADLQLPFASPSERRKFLDRSIAALWPYYLNIARDYKKVLQNRNRVLTEQTAGWKRMLEVFDQQLASLGAKIIASRMRYVRGITSHLSEIFEKITQSGVKGRMRYEAPIEFLQAEDKPSALEPILRRHLESSRSDDIHRKMTTSGPHTHDFELLLDDHPIKTFGSQGQLRTCILSLKLSQIIDIKDKNGHFPVLLLDDVSSELDALRSQFLFDFLMHIPCQTFITTTRPELIDLVGERKNFQVVRGVIEEDFAVNNPLL